MDTTRESELEQVPQVQQAPAAPVAAPATPAAIPAGPFSPSGVMALQRLVGNAAVAGMIADQQQEARAPSGGGIGEATGQVGAGIGGAVDGAATAAGSSGGGIGGIVGGVIDAANAAAGAAGGGVGAAAGQVGAGIGGAVGGEVDGAAPGAGSGAAAPGGGGIGGIVGGVIDAANAAAGAAGGGVGAAAGQVGAGIGGAVGSEVDGAAPASGAAAAGSGGIGGAVAGVLDAAGAAAGAVGAGVAGAAAQAGAGVAQAVAGGAAAGAAGAAGAAPGQAAAGGAGAGAAAPGQAAAGGAGAAGGAAQTAAGGGGAAGGAAGAAGSAAAAPGQAAAGGGGAGGAAAGAAAPAPRRDPSEDPGFQAMKGKAAAAGGSAKAHQPAAAGAAAAQAASVPPGNDLQSQAAGAQVEEMGAQQPGTFDRKAFIAAVQKAIDAAAPKNLEEADDFKGSGKAAQVKGEVGQLVKGGKKDAEKDIKGATDAPPDTSKATPKPVTPLQPDEPGAATASVGAAAAMPGPRPPEETDLSAGPAEVDQEMEREGVTEEQLANSNEPDFTGALDARQTAKEHSEKAPQEYRAQESEIVAKGQDEAQQIEATGLAGMHGSKVAALAKVAGAKGETKSQDEQKRAQVASDIQAIYDKTKTETTEILTGLDGKVDSAFSSGEESARKQFEDYVGAKMDAYKDDRYSGWLGGARWLKDKLFGMPDEVNVFYSDGRKGYLTAMDAVIGQVADIVGGELNRARVRIAQGRADVRTYVQKLPADLQQVGKDAESKLETQFDQLSSEVDAKQDALVDTLAKKYVDSRDALDSRIEELKAANRGLVAKALDAVVGVIKTILKLKDMLLGVLAKAADVITDIITDPIGFLGRLVDGVKSGLNRFVDNIATHLENGLMGWLFGALGDAGIQMPKTFDLMGIFDLAMQILGLTYQRIRGRVAKIVGEPIVSKMEQTVEVFKMLATKGVAGLWEWIKEKVGDFQEMVLGGLKTFIIERVIKGGIMWLLSLLNPAAAFIKACKAIYDIVMFIVERGQEIMEFVNSILDSIGAIARGQIGIVAEKVEGALAKALPLAISFLASLLGLGGISDKIRESIEMVRKPIEKAVDFVVVGAVKGFKKLFGGAIGWVKGKYEKGKTWAKEKATAAKDWAVGKAKSAVGWTLEKLGLVTVEEQFDMEGEDHEVKATADPEGSLQITMASHVAVALKPLVIKAIAKVKGSSDKDKKDAGDILDDVLKDLEDADTAWDAKSKAIKAKLRGYARNKDATDKEISEQAAPLMEDGEKSLKTIVKRAVNKIRKIKAKSITALLDDVGERRVFPPTFINVEGKFRGELYDKPAKWGSTRAAFISAEEPKLHAKVKELAEVGKRKAEGKRVPKAEYDKAHETVELMADRWSGDPAVGKKVVAPGRLDEAAIGAFEAGFLLELYESTPYDVDHIEPLAEHWKTDGFKSGDAERAYRAGLGNPGNLQLLTATQNRSKGGKDDAGTAHNYFDHPYVEDPFSSGSDVVKDIEWIQVDK